MPARLQTHAELLGKLLRTSLCLGVFSKHSFHTQSGPLSTKPQAEYQEQHSTLTYVRCRLRLLVRNLGVEVLTVAAPRLPALVRTHLLPLA